MQKVSFTVAEKKECIDIFIRTRFKLLDKIINIISIFKLQINFQGNNLKYNCASKLFNNV